MASNGSGNYTTFLTKIHKNECKTDFSLLKQWAAETSQSGERTEAPQYM